MNQEENLKLYEFFYEELPATYAQDLPGKDPGADDINTIMDEHPPAGLSTEQVSKLADDSIRDAATQKQASTTDDSAVQPPAEPNNSL